LKKKAGALSARDQWLRPESMTLPHPGAESQGESPMTTDTLEKSAKEGFRLERSTRIQAPAAAIFPFINDLHRWVAWSPYERLDPAVRRTYSGEAEGVGAVYEWAGNKKIGSGRMEILRAQEPSRVVIKLDFFTPFEGHNTAEFTIAPDGDASRVTWAMYGPDMCPNPVMKFFMGLFFNMEKVVGGQFEEGLANLKAAAEARA
jgi:hypothetical protein